MTLAVIVAAMIELFCHVLGIILVPANDGG